MAPHSAHDAAQYRQHGQPAFCCKPVAWLGTSGVERPKRVALRLFKTMPSRIDGMCHLDDAPGLGHELDGLALSPLRRELPA
jgi:hypothetical protein